LASNAVEITLQRPVAIGQIEERSFADIWKARYIAEQHLSTLGYENRLCYSKTKKDSLLSWQVVAYPSLPLYLDNTVFRKIYSVWKQTAVLFRTVFPSSPLSEEDAENARSFWTLSEPRAQAYGSEKSGSGALTKDDVIQKQLVYPDSVSDARVLILYNYAPLRTGEEQIHFLLVPNPTQPAKNFMELDKEQYVEVLALTKRVAQWAEKEFGGRATVHFFDKTGEIAGQTQPLYHAHLIIVAGEEEELWGKLSMFLRMLSPPRPLPADELARRVQHYRESLRAFALNGG
jgi:diadenosine tetraphosphate (Ap4A) HIT family hydrolase